MSRWQLAALEWIELACVEVESNTAEHAPSTVLMFFSAIGIAKFTDCIACRSSTFIVLEFGGASIFSPCRIAGKLRTKGHLLDVVEAAWWLKQTLCLVYLRFCYRPYNSCDTQIPTLLLERLQKHIGGGLAPVHTVPERPLRGVGPIPVKCCRRLHKRCATHVVRLLSLLLCILLMIRGD